MSERPESLPRAVALAALAAAALLVTIVLPAEYGIDPLGTGELTGVIALSTPKALVVHDEERAWTSDAVAFELAPFESVEYKFELARGSSLQFAWSAPFEIAYELHGEPEGGPKGFAESFDKGRAEARSGAFTAPFSGRHGWYFENRRFETIRVELEVVGFFAKSYRFSGGLVEETSFGPPMRDEPSGQ